VIGRCDFRSARKDDFLRAKNKKSSWDFALFACAHEGLAENPLITQDPVPEEVVYKL
jgi:hypothetical protein